MGACNAAAVCRDLMGHAYLPNGEKRGVILFYFAYSII